MKNEILKQKVNMFLKQKDIIESILLALFCAAIIFPFLYITKYAIYCSDDFSIVLHLKDYGLIGSIKRIYFQWQGTYSGSSLLYIFSMFTFSDLRLQMECIITQCLLYCSLYWFGTSILKYLCGIDNLKFRVLIICLSILYLYLSCNPSELLYWHSGIFSYTLPLVLGIIAITISINRYNCWITCVGGLCAFVAVGGTLQIGGILCSTLLIIELWRGLKYKRIECTSLVFFSAFMGSLFNALAPGNYVRKEAISSGNLLLLGAGRVAVQDLLKELLIDCKNGSLILLLVIVVIVTLCYKGEFRLISINPLFLLMIILIIIASGNYPVELGYSCEGLSIRARFVERIVYSIFLTVFFTYFMLWIYDKYRISRSNDIVLVYMLIGLVVFSSYISTNELKNVTVAYAYQGIINGDFDDYKRKSEYIMDEIEKSDNDDVVVECWMPNDLGIMCPIGLSDDKNWWLNSVVARYYGKKSVRLIEYR